MNRNWSKITDILLPMIGVALAMLLTPQFGLWGAASFDLDRIRFLFLFLVISIFWFNHLSGVDVRMFLRNKSEYIVNRLVSTFIAWVFVDCFLAVAKNELIGRAVLMVGVFFDLVISFGFYYFFGCGRLNSGVVGVFDNCCEDSVLIKDLERENFNVVKFKSINRKEVSDFLNTMKPVAVIVDPSRNDASCNQFVVREFGGLALSQNLFRRRFFQRVPLEDIRSASWWMISSPLTDSELLFMKRVFDIMIAMIGLLVSIPVLVFVWLSYLFFDTGPLIYSQVRLGQFGRPFRIFKIRSMRIDSEISGPRWASINDNRTTKLGRWLRRSRLDEVPQFWNVLVGDMSFIGPRPERPEMAEIICRSVPEFSVRLAAKPGITGWAQVCYPYGSSIEDAIHKLEYDVYYIQNAGLRFEVKILLRTIIAMVKGAR
jgi:lipopolysaccharide/colanic/teichoic acid biosynthesis glycosyltransferase